ncbi:MAG: hypothetical protein KAV01_02145, partial [Candidatus Lokiarchaeota archaeon]|nr:hypothetical protein [Candidatus Lokiarchaeota archaeon]
MEEEKLKYYSLSKYTCYENLLEGQIASAGAHQAKLIEKFKKNKNYIKHQFLALKCAFAFLFIFLPILPLVTYFQIQDSVDSGIYSMNSIVFVSSLVFMIFSGMITLYMLMFGLISTSSFMSGNAFKWLQTLPFSKKSLKKIGFMTIFRTLDIPLIILIAGFPIIMLIVSQDIIIFLISVVISIVNVMFSFSMLVIIGEKMSYIFSESKAQSKRANLVRLITMLGYFIIMFGTSFIFSWGINAVDGLFNIFTTTEPSFLLIIIVSLIPFLSAPAFLMSLTNIQFQADPILILTTLTGFALSIVLTWVLFKTAQNALRSALSTEIKIEKVKKKDVQFEMKAISPIKAYLRKDIVSSTRDLQSFMFIFFPIFYPLIMVFTMQGVFVELVTSTQAILIIWSIILLIYMFIPIMLIVGFLNIEESGSSTVASLPILPRDQAKAKLLLMLTIQGLSLILASIVLTILLNSIIVILLLLVTLPIAWTFLLFMFEMKIKLFGQMKYKYVIEELNKEHKIIKWVSMILSEMGIYMAILITGIILISFIGLEITILVMGIIGITALSTLIFVFTRMFPKVEKIKDYVTGGFLREHVNIGTASLMILIFCFGLLVIPIELLFLPIILNLSFLEVMFLEFVISFGLFALLWFVVVPRGLKLPRKESFKDFSRTIGLSTVKPLWRNIFLGVISIVIFGLSLILVGNLLGTWFLDWSILFGNPSITTGFGWFIFILMLIPGIWEEVAFRGVI